MKLATAQYLGVGALLLSGPGAMYLGEAAYQGQWSPPSIVQQVMDHGPATIRYMRSQPASPASGLPGGSGPLLELAGMLDAAIMVHYTSKGLGAGHHGEHFHEEEHH